MMVDRIRGKRGFFSGFFAAAKDQREQASSPGSETSGAGGTKG